MPRPALVKLGGSLLTDKGEESSFRRPAARRLLSEVAKANLPTVLLHGAGSFGHPQAARHRLGHAKAKPDGVSEVLAAVGALAAQMVSLAHEAGLRPLAFPLHHAARIEGDALADVPFEAICKAIEEGYTPVLHGTLVRDPALGWRVVSADELMQHLAAELTPRLAVFATNVDGVYDRDPADTSARLLVKVDGTVTVRGGDGSGTGSDVTGRMAGKLGRARAAAMHCPTLILNGEVKGRLLDALKGKPVPCSRVEA
ncbi:MAG TPA: isopentenyl phosphate kinase [Candidatus Thermoplasmatota archaeon]|nr:isopentenyl phosphate kinase [Candidatus Thermoplasmatota archaeon]